MEIRENYQQTTIGIIPSDWRFEPLKIFCKSSAFGPRFSGDLYSSNGNVATLRTTDLDINGKINYATMPTAQLDESKFKDHLLCENDFLITRSGTCGIAAVFKSFEKPVLPGAFLIRFRFKDDIDVHFIKYYVNSKGGQRQMEQISLGAVQKNISGTSLLNTSFPFPSLSEQTAIATALNDADALITQLEKLVAKKRAIKQGAMQELLKPKEGWVEKPISDITSMMTNGFVGTIKSHYTDYENGILYIQGYNVEENSFNFNGIKRVTVEFHKLHSKSCLQEGDLLTIQTGDIGVTTFVPKELVGANCHALIITRFIKGTADSKFYSYYFNFSKGRSQLKEIETGSTMKHINVGDMIQLLIPYPPLVEQTRIAQILSDMDAEIEVLEKKLEKTKKIKQGMMQELLTGRIRLEHQ